MLLKNYYCILRPRLFFIYFPENTRPITANTRHLLEINLAMLCISSSGILGRYVPLDPGPAIWWRCFLAALLLYGYCRYKGFALGIGRGKQLGAVLVSGVLVAIHWVTYFYALKLSSVAVGMLAMFTYPAMTTLLEPLLTDKKLETHHLLLAGLVVLGVYFLAPGDFNLDNEMFIGMLFGLGSALIYSLRNIMMKSQVKRLNGSVVMLWQVMVSLVVLAPVLFFSPAVPSLEAAPYLIGLALVTTAIGHTLFLGSFRHFSISSASLLSCVQPVYGILLGVLFFKEIPTWTSVIGGILILSAVVVEALRTVRMARIKTPK